MKMKKRLTSAVLLLSMLLSLLGGGVVNAAAVQTVTPNGELAYAPLADENASIAYEQHEDGYVVSLDRAADNVTINITGAPSDSASRAPEKARLYIRTGVELKPGTAYQVGFSLSADKAQDYAVRFDGAAEAAYGRLNGRSVAAGGSDQVKYLVTPKAENGELVLCLLLGKTEGNTLRFSDLAVEAAPEAQTGENVLLVDDLDYSAPGGVSYWANTGIRVAVTSDGKSTTMNIIEKPDRDVAIWEVQLKMATGFKPQPGKTYRVSATLKSSAKSDRQYEVCFNEGSVEKGYDALYGQWMTGNKQNSFSHRIVVPADKENPGELVLQFSVGCMKDGESVTVSNIRIEEATPKYTNALAQNFAFNKTWTDNEKKQEISGGTPVDTKIDLTRTAYARGIGASVVEGSLTYSEDRTSVSMKINPDGRAWEARFHIFTAESLTAGTRYRVTFKVDTKVPYNLAKWHNPYKDNEEGDNQCELFFGTGLDGVDNNKTCHQNADDKVFRVFDKGETTVVHEFTAKEDGELLISLFAGNTKKRANTLTVSDIKVQEMAVEESNTLSPTLANAEVRKWEFNGEIQEKTSDSVKMVCWGNTGEEGDAWRRGLLIKELCDLEPNAQYEVSFDINANKDTAYNVHFSDEAFADSNLCDAQRNLNTSSTGHITQTITAPDSEKKLNLRLDLGRAENDAVVTVSNLKVEKVTDGTKTNVDLTVDTSGDGTFEVRKLFYNGEINSSSANSTTMTCWGGKVGGMWQRGLMLKEVCDLKQDFIYEVKFNVEAEKLGDGEAANTKYNVRFNKDDAFAGGNLASQTDLWTWFDEKKEITQIIKPDADGKLYLLLDLGEAERDLKITVSDLEITETKYDATGSEPEAVQFGSVWAEFGEGYDGSVVRGKDSVDFSTWKTDNSTGVENWKAKLIIDTGVPYERDKGYRFSFDFTSSEAQKGFGAGYNKAESIDTGTWGHTLAPDETKTIVSHGLKNNNGNVTIVIEMGNFTGPSNTATISNIQVEEVDVVNYTEKKVGGTVTYDVQPGYTATLDRNKDSATLNIAETPAVGAEIWKRKMFIETGIDVKANEAYRVTFDLLAEQDADFEVCYNQSEKEKNYGAIYGLHAEAGKVKTIEHTFSAREDGKLIIQPSLGLVQAGNAITVRNLKVERISYSNSSKSVLPAAIDYKAPSAVSYWAHEDYTVNFTNPGDSGDAVTANITGTPSVGAEGWKIKLFLDTGVALQAGKYYKVTADVVGQNSQNFEVCYNNGGVENGYDSMGGLRLIAGQPQTVEKLISVPANKTDAANLTLQFNLGNTTSANAVTVSGVKVEEVSLSYAEMMAKDFAYKADSEVSLWTYSDYTATMDTTNDSATVHITGAPAADTAVWKVKLFVNTGAILQAGKTYLVRADMLAAKGQNYEVCFNNEETEKGFDALYGQTITAGNKVTVEKSVSVPASMTDAGELVLQFAVGGDVTNDITVSNVSVQEMSFGAGGSGTTPDTVINLTDAAGTLDVTREKLTYKTANIPSEGSTISVAGANLRSGDLYTVVFTARAGKEMTGTLALNQGQTAVLSESFQLTPEKTEYAFTTKDQLSEGGFYDILWKFASEDNQNPGGAEVEISNISVYCPPEKLDVTQSAQNVTVNGQAAVANAYNINGSNYFKLRDLAVLLNNTDAQFVVRYNKQSNMVSLTTGKAYTPIGGELETGADLSASCVRSSQDILVNGSAVNLKAYNIGGNNFFRLRDLAGLLGFTVDYIEETNTVALASPLTPEAQEKAHAYDIFFLPEVDGEAQPYVGDTMPYYEDGVYYIYYLKDGGDSYNHSVYVTTTKDFVHYTEHDDPVLSASREDVQDNWIGTGSVVKVDNTYYFFYTGFNASGSQEYHEKIMVAKSSSPTGTFEKVAGWEIVPPASLGQKNDFRDPQAYYDPATQTISLTITAAQDGKARILKYTLGKDLQNANYDGIIYTDPTGAFWNLECSDTFQIGNKWYLTYSGQDDTLWYAMADSRFGPYTNAARLDGTLFYAAKHVEDGTNSYMVGWARKANSASSTQEVNGWAGNVAVQKLQQQADGTLTLVPVDSIVSAFDQQKALSVSEAVLTADSDRSYKEVCTSDESFMLSGEFTYTGTGSFGLAFDFSGKEDQYKLISINPATNKLRLSLNGGAAPITETQVALQANQKYSFTYIQDGSVGIFYLDGQAALTVRLYGVTDKPVRLFAENNSVTFTSLQQYTR